MTEPMFNVGVAGNWRLSSIGDTGSNPARSRSQSGGATLVDIFDIRNSRDKSEDLPFEAMPEWAQMAFDARGIDRSKYETFVWLSNPSTVKVVLETGVVIDFPETKGAQRID